MECEHGRGSCLLEKQSPWKCRQHGIRLHGKWWERWELRGSRGSERFRGLSYRTQRMGCWRNIRGTSITLEEAKALVSMTKTRIKQDDLHVFDWDLTDRDQGHFDTKMMSLLWFKEGSVSRSVDEFSWTSSRTRGPLSNSILLRDPGTRLRPFSSE